MQTVLESLEQAYLNVVNIEEEADRNENIDTYLREENYCVKTELTKAIVLLVNSGDVVPIDKRVYVDMIDSTTFARLVSAVKNPFIEALYKHEILTREKTVGDLISELQRFAPSLKVNVLGNNNSMDKIVIDDTYIDKIVLVGVEN